MKENLKNVKIIRKRFLKSTKGITLVALVVTIVVLLILAGVSINMVIGENGIITKAQEAKEKAEQAQREEYGLISDLSDYIANGGEAIFDESQGVNKPKLSAGMIPVKYDKVNKTWVICSTTDTDWYKYNTTDKQWANVMLSDGKYYSQDANLSTEEKASKTLASEGTPVVESDLGSMFVWIPRFAYKITARYHDTTPEDNPGGMDVKFLVGRSDKTADNATIVEYNSRTTNNFTKFPDGYVVHPAFKNGNGDYSNGEWKAEVLGIWVAKFQAGIKTTENDTSAIVASVSNYLYPVFKGRKFGYNYVSESECYNLSLALDDNGNPYGLTNASNSHLMKSSEWGAAAYLSMSQYGYSGGIIKPSTEKARNNFDIDGTATHPNNSSRIIYGITGYSALAGKSGRNAQTFSSVETTFTDEVGSGETISYAWNITDTNSATGNGTKSSTTGNIYGVYDMSCGLADYTATYVNNTKYTENGSAFATGKSTYLATAYPKKGTTHADFSTAYYEGDFKYIYGDAIWETSNLKEGVTSKNSWFENTLYGNTSDGCSVFFHVGDIAGLQIQVACAVRLDIRVMRIPLMDSAAY